MASIKRKLVERDLLFQRLVFISRIVIDRYATNGEIPPKIFAADFKALIKDADNLGVHGAAFLDVDSKAAF
jgi:hypothetical protein